VGGYNPGGFWNLIWSDDSFGPGAPFSWGTSDQLQPVIAASLAQRATAYTTVIGDTLKALPNFPGGPTGTRPLIAAKLPFRVIGTDGQPVDSVFLLRHTPGNITDSILKNSILLGTNGDTSRVSVPPDLWMPSDTVYVIERRVQDSTVVVGGNTVAVVRDT